MMEKKYHFLKTFDSHPIIEPILLLEKGKWIFIIQKRN